MDCLINARSSCDYGVQFIYLQNHFVHVSKYATTRTIKQHELVVPWSDCKLAAFSLQRFARQNIFTYPSYRTRLLLYQCVFPFMRIFGERCYFIRWTGVYSAPCPCSLTLKKKNIPSETTYADISYNVCSHESLLKYMLIG